MLLRPPFRSARLLILALLLLVAAGLRPATAQVSFTPDAFTGVLNNPTSLQFGPDGRLYVSQQDGTLYAFTVERNAAADYSIVETEQIDLISSIPNHNDDGSPCTTGSCSNKRQVTGVLATGTPTNPVIYVSSSDPRIGAGGGGNDLGLDTNSGIISRLTCTGGVVLGLCDSWEIVHMVRGLPRSEENHASNGMQLDTATNTLYLAQGGHTNAGSPSNNFALTTEYAYSAAILSIDLDAIVALGIKTDSEGQDYYYDLPTLDDPDRANTSAVDGYTEATDPFGGNDGKNQAKIDLAGPVQIHASGFRNLFDIVLTDAGRMYGIDNGANGGWGGHPAGEADYPTETTTGVCTNQYLAGEPGSNGTGPGGDPQVNNKNGLHYIRELVPGDDNYVQAGEIYYGGHPSPIRGNPAGAGLYYNGAWLTSTGLPADWPPVPVSEANPAECDFRNSGDTDNALANFGPSTNGITEYTASNFSGALQGDLLAAGYDGSGPIYQIELSPAGDVATNCPANPATNCSQTLLTGFGSQPLDVIAQGDNDIFPGTIWAVTYGADDLVVFEPSDYDGGSGGLCIGTDDDTIDEDFDLYSNADEIDNGTNPCSAGSIPDDFDGSIAGDGFKDSNLNDPDDDDDTVLDVDDSFALDVSNGFATSLPIQYDLFNDTPGVGVTFFGLGFTGIMTNGSADYLNQFVPPSEPGGVIAGGTAGLLTYVTTNGDTYQGNNTQENAFQFGIDVDAGTPAFTIQAQINGPFFDGNTPGNWQSQGIQIGTGDMDNYVKLVLSVARGFEVVSEVNGTATGNVYDPTGDELAASAIGLFLAVDPAAGTVTPSVSLDGGTRTTFPTITLTGNLLDVVQGNYEVAPGVPSALAVGTIATSFNGNPPFSATWDFFEITLDPTLGDWQFVDAYDEVRHENAFVAAGDKFYLIGGRETQTVEIYDPASGLWSDGATLPTGPGWPDKLHHFQALEHQGLIYVVGALTGNCCEEPPAERVYIYDPVADTWMQGPEIPVARRRGGAGAVVYNDKIYLVSGNTNGHFGPVSPFFDMLDPVTGVWTQLPDIPNARDHFFAVVANDKIYVAAGRDSDGRPVVDGGDGDIFDDTIAQVDVFDIGSQNWTTLPSIADIPTPRAAAATVLLGSEIVVAGGEDGSVAHDVTEAFDIGTETWRTLDPMLGTRHATQGIVSNGGLYIAAGSPQQGGPGGASPDLEAFYFFGPTTPNGVAIAAASLSVPASLDFGQILVGSTDTQAIDIFNNGTEQAILVESVDLTGSATFTLIAPLTSPVVVPPGGSLSFDVTFDPTVAQLENAGVAVTHSGGTVENVAVAGEGFDPIAFALRINSGGPAYVDSNLDSWVADQQFVGGTDYSNGSLSDGDIAGTIDDTIYLTERNSGANLAPFAYAINVPAAGLYSVDLHFAEIYHGATGGGAGGTGKRVFSVSVEGGSQLVNYDLNAEVAPQTAVVKTFVVNVSDGVLNIDLTASVDRPKLSGVGVFGYGGNAPPVVAGIPDQMNAEGDDVSGLFVAATDTDGPQSLQYAAVGLPSGVQLEPTNGQFFGTIAAGAAVSSPYAVTVNVSDGADVTPVNFMWTVSEPTNVLYRVNNGGNVLAHGDGSPDWQEDRKASGTPGGSATLGTPSPYVNLTPPAVDQTYGPTSFSISNATGAPDLLFAHERWSDAANPDNMNWEFPVSNGDYEVNLYFAENWSGAASPGVRVFDVLVEGNLVLDDYDVYVAAGNAINTAVKESYVATVGDGVLNINFEKGAQNPAIKGIEILSIEGTANNIPTIDPIDDLALTEGDNVVVDITATDLDVSDTITLSIEIVDDATTTPVPGTEYIFTDGGAGSANLVWQTAADAEGSYTATVTADDGTDQSTEQFAIVLGDHLPTIAVSSPIDQAVVFGDQVTVIWTASNALLDDHVHVTIDAEPYVGSQPLNGSYTFTNVGEGPHTITVEIADAAHTVYANPEAQQAVDVDVQAQLTALYRVNAGGPEFLDGAGNTWAADAFFTGGTAYAPAPVQTAEITGTDDDVLYRSERYGDPFTYSFPVSNGMYSLQLLFAEIYQGVNAGGGCPVGGDCSGLRLFDVQVEGVNVLDEYDIYTAAGASLAAVVETVTGVDVQDGSLDVTFLLSPGLDNAKVSAMAVFPESVGPGLGPMARVSINAGEGIFASTFTASSISIQNLGDVNISSVSIDLRTALLPDVAFDPTGEAGDAVAKCLVPDAGAAATGYVSPTDPCADPFSQVHNGTGTEEGFDVMSMDFTDFGMGETFALSVDIDPTSIKNDTNSGDAGAVSGLEMSGATVTVVFADATTIVANLFADGSEGGSTALAAPDAPGPVSISSGLSNPTLVSDVNQTIQISGPPDTNVQLLQVDARLYIDDPSTGGGYDIDPFEANEALAVVLYSGTTNASGLLSVPVTVLKTASPNAGPDAGINHFIAVSGDIQGHTGQTSNSLILELATPRVTDDLLALYTFEEGQGTTINDVSGVGTPLNLSITSGTPTWDVPGALNVSTPSLLSSAGAAAKVVNGVKATEEITLEAWVKPANVTQFGPARIAALSGGAIVGANVAMGPGPGSGDATKYDVRLKSTSTNKYGNPSLTTLAGFVTTNLTHVVFTRTAAGVTTTYIDGTAVATGTTGGSFSNWSDYALTLANVPSNDRAWLGELHLVAIYGQALTSSEVSQNYSAGPDGILPTQQYTVAANIVGNGTVAKNPDQALYDLDDVVELTATADPGWEFTGWSGALTGTDNPQSVTVDGNVVVTATFTALPQYTVTANIVGSGGVVNTPDQPTYLADDVVELLAVPSAGWVFAGWSGALTGTTNPQDVTIAGDVIVTATFVQPVVGLAGALVVSEVSSGASPVTLTFGTVTGGTDGTDPALDVLLPPPPPELFDARFTCTTGNTLCTEDLSTDIRALIADGETIIWTVSFNREVSTNDIGLDWGGTSFPTEGTVTLRDPLGILPDVDMTTQSSYLVTQDGISTMLIVYDLNGIGTSFDRSVAEGWNLIGLPLLVPDNDVAVVFPTATPGTLYGFDPETGYQTETTVDLSKGYWLKFGAAGVQAIQGSLVQQLAISVPAAGWHLVAGPSCSVPVGSVNDPDGILVPNSIFGFGAAGYTAATSVDQGQGYWVLSTDAGQVTMTCAPQPPSIAASIAKSAAPVAEVVEEAAGFRALLVRDGAEAERMLYFGSELDASDRANAYSLPPIPPSGAFDVRFEGAGRLIETGEGTVRVQASSFPLSLSLVRDPLSSGERLLLDEIADDRVVATHELNLDSPVSIGNESVTALRLRKVVEVAEVVELPTAFEVHGSYPNPFTGTATITLDLPEEAEIRIQLIDVLGRVVQTMPDVTMAAGTARSVQIQASPSLAAGTYFYQVRARMATGTAVKTSRMTLMK